MPWLSCYVGAAPGAAAAASATLRPGSGRRRRRRNRSASACSRSGSTIPYWLVIVAGVLTIVGSILAAELWLARHAHADASDALAAVLYFFLDAISAFFVTGLVTEVGACRCVWVLRRRRPQALHRHCLAGFQARGGPAAAQLPVAVPAAAAQPCDS